MKVYEMKFMICGSIQQKLKAYEYTTVGNMKCNSEKVTHGVEKK